MRSERPAWKQLIGHAPATDERTSLIVRIFSDREEVEMVGHLSGDDAKALIDAVFEVSLPNLTPDRQVDGLDLNLRTFSIRRWIDSHRGSAGGVCTIYTGFAAAKPCFRSH